MLTINPDGSMRAKERNEAVDKLTEDPNCNIMLVSLKAGNAGLNLTCASQVVILDPFWNPFIEEQAIDRAHRIGQTRDVHVHRILIEGTVEDRIIALQEKKRTVINQALDEKAAQSLSRLGREELIFLFVRPTCNLFLRSLLTVTRDPGMLTAKTDARIFNMHMGYVSATTLSHDSLQYATLFARLIVYYEIQQGI